jgi:hypothetical protein
MVAAWVGSCDLQPAGWTPCTSTGEWWLHVTSIPNTPRKGLRALRLLISWEIWKERNNHICYRRESSVPSLVSKIKAEASLWIAAGAKDLALLLVRE